jgi:uncharacterized protein (DUF427 family)
MTTAIRIEPSSKRVRAVVGGRCVADSSSPLLVWERPYYPTYYLPRADVVLDAFDAGAVRTRSEAELADHVSLKWSAADHWFEEDEEVFVHPRDPYKRVDILRSSRHVVVEVDGTVVADSRQPTMLFETSLPRRHYLPLVDVRMDLLEPSATRTYCPYKGEASYWHVRVGDTLHEDLAWSYPYPVRESGPIAGLVCFYDERIDLTVDGERVGRPETPFSGSAVRGTAPRSDGAS